jgi:hypothetical protein
LCAETREAPALTTPHSCFVLPDGPLNLLRAFTVSFRVLASEPLATSPG